MFENFQIPYLYKAIPFLEKNKLNPGLKSKSEEEPDKQISPALFDAEESDFGANNNIDLTPTRYSSTSLGQGLKSYRLSIKNYSLENQEKIKSLPFKFDTINKNLFITLVTNMDFDDLKILNKFCENNKFKKLPVHVNFTHLDLLQNIDLCALNKKNTDISYIVKKYKVQILKDIETNLKCIIHNLPLPEKVPPKKISILNKIGCAFTAVVNIILGGVFNYLGINAMLLLIPGISTPVRVAVSVILTLIESCIFLSFELSFVEKSFGVEFIPDRILLNLKLDEAELESCKNINKLMREDEIQSHPKFVDECKKIDIFINNNLKEKMKRFDKEEQEKPRMIIAKHLVTLVGGFLVTAQMYFGMSTLLASLFPYLLGTPVGWAIMGAALIANLVLYVAFRATGVENMNQRLLKQIELVKLSKEIHYKHFKVNKKEVDRLARSQSWGSLPI